MGVRAVSGSGPENRRGLKSSVLAVILRGILKMVEALGIRPEIQGLQSQDVEQGVTSCPQEKSERPEWS